VAKKKVQTAVWKGLRVVEPGNRRLSVARQCQLLGVSRSRHYYNPKPERRIDIEEKLLLQDLYLKIPFYGYRKMALELQAEGVQTSEKRVRRLMNQLSMRALSPKRLTSVRNKEHPVYPYLLKNKPVRYPNQVWASDITYLKLETGFAYLVAIMDVYSRKVLTWRLSQNMDSDFCIEALKDAFTQYGVPAIFNTDQGSQFTSYGFIKQLKDRQVRISMDGKGRWRDNIYVERLWRSVKYEDIYLKSYESFRALKHGITRYIRFYNTRRFHQGLYYKTPDEQYESFQVRLEDQAA
jgi:putative transposase